MSANMRDAGLLARDAEGLFWMARYLERVENMARLIDVTQSFESPGFETDAWWGLIRINADEARFKERGFSADAAHIKRFYLLDIGNPTSVPASLEDARTNARTLRPLISTEMWRQINVFQRFVSRIGAADLEGDALSRLCTRLKDGVQAHTGITEGTLYRDQGWYFYELGRLVERADQTTRMLDIKYTALLPRGGGEEKRMAELTQWHAVLRAAAVYHAFKRRARAIFSAEDVVHFLLRDSSSPRSVLLCVRRIELHLDDLRRYYGLAATGPLEQVEMLRQFLLEKPISHILATGLHEYLDLVQIQLQNLAGAIGRAFFRDWRPEPAAPQAQAQTMA